MVNAGLTLYMITMVIFLESYAEKGLMQVWKKLEHLG